MTQTELAELCRIEQMLKDANAMTGEPAVLRMDQVQERLSLLIENIQQRMEAE